MLLHLPFYGVPENYTDSILAFLSAPEATALYEELCGLKDTSVTDILEKYHKNPYFSYALGKAAIANNITLLVPVVYAVTSDQKQYVHFEWKVPHPEVDLSFSNAFFVGYFNELYRDVPDPVGRKLAIKGVALRALAYLSYTPWHNFLLPITEDCVENFLYLPLYDRDSDFIAAQGAHDGD